MKQVDKYTPLNTDGSWANDQASWVKQNSEASWLETNTVKQVDKYVPWENLSFYELFAYQGSSSIRRQYIHVYDIALIYLFFEEFST